MVSLRENGVVYPSTCVEEMGVLAGQLQLLL